MNIQQHYLINLKRRPERLFGWLGAQHQMDFDFEKLTVVEAHDGAEYQTVGSLFMPVRDYFFQRGIDYRGSVKSESTDRLKIGLRCLLITRLIIFLHLEERINSDDYFMMWEDDVYLNYPYKDLIDVQLPADATMIAFHTPDPINHLKKHRTLPFRHGAHHIRAPQAFVFNKEGLSKILNLYRKERMEYDLEPFFSHYNNLPGLYSSEKNYAHLVHFSDLSSDIVPVKGALRQKKYPEIRWNTFSILNETKRKA